ncbi:MAG: flagellin [Pirellulales bacterium]|nr:flagellin [Pirellulales bacterium]
MTRINTNVSSLNAQKSLARSNADLQTALTRLSTGLRINVGKDDPAGLIASEVLRSDMISVERAITNSERANQMIATADSALGQVSSLLNDIRGLVSEAANTGAMSEEQISANQLQVDSSLEAIDRIAQVTSFQGKRLLDGNLDFVTSSVDPTKVSNLEIQQANFGTQTQINVTVDVVAQAEQAELAYTSSSISDDVVLEIGGSKGFEAFSFAANSTISEMAAAINLVSDALGVQAVVDYNIAQADGTGEVQLTTAGSTGVITIAADTVGREGGNIAIEYATTTTAATAPVTAATASWDGTGDVNKITVTAKTLSWTAAAGVAVTSQSGSDLVITPQISGAQFDNMTLQENVLTAGAPTASNAVYDYDTNVLTLTVKVGATAGAAASLIGSKLAQLFTATATNTATTYAASGTSALTGATGAGGRDGGAVLASITDVRAAINTDVTVAANVTATGTSADTVTLVTHAAFYGNENTGGTSEPNNRIQLLSTAAAADLPITFRTLGTSQALSLDFTQNAETGGYATAILQGTNADASIKVVSKTQGTAYDGITISLEQDATDNSIAWDREAKTIKIYRNYDGGAVTATTLVTDLTAALGDSFTFSVFGGGAGGGALTKNTSATTDGGNEYTAINVNLATDANGNITSTAADVVTAINNSATLQALDVSGSHVGTSDGSGLMQTGSTAFTQAGVTKQDGYAGGTTNNRGGENAQLTVTALTGGAAYDNVSIVFRDDPDIAAGTADERVSYNASTKELNIYIQSGTSTLSDVLTNYTAANNPTEYGLFRLAAVGTGAGTLYSTDTGKLTGGRVDAGTADGAVAMSGAYDEGDVIGTTGLTFKSVNYGSKEFISVKVLDGTLQTIDPDGNTTDRDTGSDVNVRLNGIQAISDGLNVSMNTSVLDLSFTLDSGVAAGTTMNFQITGGGAQFQLGPDVVSNQQARLGISSVSTAKLGGISGRLYELRSGGTKDLGTDVGGAASVVDEVITQVTTLRGRLGAFQKTTLDSNIASLKDTLENLTAAESSIRDADFAAESAALTRAQILVQSGVSVLSMANSNPQNVLALLR